MAKAWLRWAPATVAVIVVAGVAVAVPASANASVSLPHKSAAQVLELVASSKVTALSGTVQETSALGLPTLPTGAGASSGSSAAADLALLTGDNSLRVYVDGSSKVRVQDLESLAERDVIRDGTNVWVYDSKDNSVLHTTLSSRDQHGSRPDGSTPAPTTDPADVTPEGLATKLLAGLRPSSVVSVSPDAVKVAGRAAYDLILAPKATDTLIGAVHIAVDAQTGLPLQVQLDARGQTTPAVSIGFSSLDLSTPAASLFAFTAPSGAKVKDVESRPAAPATSHARATAPAHHVTGTGWDAVISVSAAGSLGSLAKSSEFAELTTAVAGGRILHTSLVNILFTTDGRIVAGSVSVARLQEVASAQ